MMIIIRVISTNSKIVCFTPQAALSAKPHVKSNLSFINLFRICVSSSMKKEFDLRITSIYWVIYSNFSYKLGPYNSILDSRQFYNFWFRHRLHEFLWNNFILFSIWINFVRGYIIRSFLYFMNFFKFFRKFWIISLSEGIRKNEFFTIILFLISFNNFSFKLSLRSICQ
jgi:hypothetical protein